MRTKSPTQTFKLSEVSKKGDIQPLIPVRIGHKEELDEKYPVYGNYTALESLSGIAWGETDKESRL